MSCTNGCCATPAEHYRSLHVARVDRVNMTKTVRDDHGTHVVDVTEHWQDRQDVTVKPRTVGLTTTVKEY